MICTLPGSGFYRAVCKAVGSPIQRGGRARHAAALCSWVPGGGERLSGFDRESNTFLKDQIPENC